MQSIIYLIKINMYRLIQIQTFLQRLGMGILRVNVDMISMNDRTYSSNEQEESISHISGHSSSLVA